MRSGNHNVVYLPLPLPLMMMQVINRLKRSTHPYQLPSSHKGFYDATSE
jgi:hypothetical protein